MSHVFMEAVIYTNEWNFGSNDFEVTAYKIKHLSSPAIQSLLQMIDEGDYMKIANLGMLLVKEVSYTRVGGIMIACRKVRNNGIYRIKASSI